MGDGAKKEERPVRNSFDAISGSWPHIRLFVYSDCLHFADGRGRDVASPDSGRQAVAERIVDSWSGNPILCLSGLRRRRKPEGNRAFPQGKRPSNPGHAVWRRFAAGRQYV